MKRLLKYFFIIGNVSSTSIASNIIVSCSIDKKNNLSDISLDNLSEGISSGSNVKLIKLMLYFKIKLYFNNLDLKIEDLEIHFIREKNEINDDDNLEINDVISISGSNTNVLKGFLKIIVKK